RSQRRSTTCTPRTSRAGRTSSRLMPFPSKPSYYPASPGRLSDRHRPRGDLSLSSGGGALLGLAVVGQQLGEHAAHDDARLVGMHMHLLTVADGERYVGIAPLEDAPVLQRYRAVEG